MTRCWFSRPVLALFPWLMLLIQFQLAHSIRHFDKTIPLKGPSAPLAFFAWPDSFKLGSKKSSDLDEKILQSKIIHGEACGREARLRGGSTAESIPGPTTRPLSKPVQAQSFQTEQGNAGIVQIGSNNLLSELVSMLQAQESALMMQASRCRAASQRLIFIQQLLYNKVYSKGGEPKNQGELEEEVIRWKVSTYEMHRQLGKCLSTAGNGFAKLLGETQISLPDISSKSSNLQGALDSAVTPEQHSEEDEDVNKAKEAIAQGPTIRAIDKKRVLDTQVENSKQELRAEGITLMSSADAVSPAN